MDYARDRELFWRLCQAVGGTPNRRGFVSHRCPECGKERDHFEFNERWGHCLRCGYTVGIRNLGRQILGDESRPIRCPIPLFRRREPVPIVRPWQQNPDHWRTYLPIPERARSYYHSRGFADESIERYRLGYGVLPSSRCRYPRAILPVFDNRRLVNLRGRLLDFPCPACPIYQPEGKLRECNCRGGDKAKWLGAGGGRTVLFGAEALYPGATVVIAEAPYSAILLRQEHPETVALACMGAAWQDAWTEAVAASRPQSVGVYMDNDPTGQAAGIKIANVLLAKGLRVKRHPWPAGAPEGRDLADDLLAAIRARQGVPA